MLGLEVIKAINCFLSIRATALAPPLALLPVDPGVGNSQDEFGMFDFDYEDPALNAMLGVEAAADVVLSENRVQDKALAEVRLVLLARNAFLISSSPDCQDSSSASSLSTHLQRLCHDREQEPSRSDYHRSNWVRRGIGRMLDWLSHRVG